MAHDLWVRSIHTSCGIGDEMMYPEEPGIPAEVLFAMQEVFEVKPKFDFNIRLDGGHLFVYPLEEKPLVYLAQSTGLSKFNVFFTWYEVTENWVLRARHNGFTFCR